MRGRILVVEDDEALAAMYERVLAAHGFEVSVASTGKAGLASATELVAEGVANEADARALTELGCQLFSWDLNTTPDELAPFSSRTLAEARVSRPSWL